MFSIERAGDFVGQEVLIRGWVANFRSSGKIHFLIVRDGTGFMQCVLVKGEVPDEDFEIAESLGLESSVEIRGTIREDKRAPGGYEMTVRNLRVVSPSFDYPISKKEHGVAFLMPLRHLWVRSRKQWALLRIRAEVERAISDWLDGHGFVRFDAPILTPSACEGTSTLFPVDYFGERAYLSQSGQLYQEVGAYAFGKVYCAGPTFRAEKSKTRRHLTEFWMIEPEVAWAGLEDIILIMEEMVVYIVERVMEKRKLELSVLERDTKPLEAVKRPFPRITFREAWEIVGKAGKPVKPDEDFGADEEAIISLAFDRPVFITHYPAAIKPFYMKRDPDDPSVVLNTDLYAPEGRGEIIGGSQREDDPDALLERMKAMNMPIEDYQWYLDIRRYGRVPTAGFGLGLERTVAWIAGVHHIREAIPFPRMLERIYP
ncbi:MAG: asparagine--tRNA ligase [candidate division WOR-3 bacterium]